MRFKKVLLIYPHYPEGHYSGGRNTRSPIGLGIIGEMLKLSGVDYEVVDLGLGYDMNYLNQHIKDYKPDAVGISMMTFMYNYMYSILGELKESYGNIKIIAGGPHVTAWKTKVLEQCPAIDFGISREGEFTIKELCEEKELPTIKGLIYREGNIILFNGERELIDNLDSIPFPKYEKFELDKYVHEIRINSSRGCPYKCIFCQTCSILGKKWRGRSAANIADEIEFWHEKGYRDFTFVDDNFTLNKKRIYQLCDEMENRHLDNIHLGAGGVRVDLVDRDLLKRMREVGFYYIAFGVESGNNEILKVLKKSYTIEQAEQAVRDAVELGFNVKLYFLVGSPYETFQNIQDSINFALKYPIWDVNFSNLTPIPETELIDWVRKEGELLTQPEIYLNEYAAFKRIPFFVAPGMSLKERKYALRVTEKVGIEIRKRWKEKNAYKKISQLGIPGKLIAKIYVSTFVSYLFQHNRLLRHIKELILKKVESLRRNKQ